MAYELEAILSRRAVLERHQNRYTSACVVPLKAGWAIIPLTSYLRRELNRATEPGVWDSSTAGQVMRRLDIWIDEMSRDGVVAQIESECFGNVCGDTATVWRDGTIVLGPLRGGAMSDDSTSPLVINQALHFMGVSCEPSKEGGVLDEFDTVGLGLHRKTNQWVEQQPEVWDYVKTRPATDRPPSGVTRLLRLLPGGRGHESSQTRAIERDGSWVLPLAGAVVSQYRLAPCLYSMTMAKPGMIVKVELEGRFLLRRPGSEGVPIHPCDGEEELQPAFGLLGLTARNGAAHSGGRLEVTFTDGSSLTADPEENEQAWEVSSSRGLRIVATPGGGLAVWRE